MKNMFFSLVLIALGITSGAVIAETVALAVYWHGNKAFFYFRQSAPAQTTPVKAAQTYPSRAILNPYFGFSVPKGYPMRAYLDLDPSKQDDRNSPEYLDMSANNYGYFSPYDYPYSPQGKRYIVGVFGGSVVQWFSLMAGNRLSTRLSEAGCGEAVVLNFGLPGHKQPQGLLELAYFLSIGQRFDAVVVLDGFLETAEANNNRQVGWSAAMPSSLHLAPLIPQGGANAIRPDLARSAADAGESRDMSAKWRQYADTTHLATLHLAATTIAQYYETKRFEAASRYNDLLQHSQAQKSIAIMAPPDNQPFEAFMKDAANLWESSSRQMRALAMANGASYHHFLIPNQRFTKRKFDKDEALIALSPSSPQYDAGVRAGYPLLLEGLGRLKAEGIDAVDATGVFDNLAFRVYADNCCHFTKQGYLALADMVAQAVSADCKKQ